MKFVNKNYYELLDVAPNATDEQLRRAWRQVRSTWNPHSIALYSLYTPEEAEAIRHKLEEAYAVLSNPERRARYDRYLALTSAGPVVTRTPEAFWDLVHGLARPEQKVELMQDVSELLNETAIAEVVIEEVLREVAGGDAVAVDVVVREERVENPQRAAARAHAQTAHAQTAHAQTAHAQTAHAQTAHANPALARVLEKRTQAPTREKREGVPAAPAAPPPPPPATPERLASPSWTPAASPRDAAASVVERPRNADLRNTGGQAVGQPPATVRGDYSAATAARGVSASPSPAVRPQLPANAPALPIPQAPSKPTSKPAAGGSTPASGAPGGSPVPRPSGSPAGVGAAASAKPNAAPAGQSALPSTSHVGAGPVGTGPVGTGPVGAGQGASTAGVHASTSSAAGVKTGTAASGVAATAGGQALPPKAAGAVSTVTRPNIAAGAPAAPGVGGNPVREDSSRLTVLNPGALKLDAQRSVVAPGAHPERGEAARLAGPSASTTAIPARPSESTGTQTATLAGGTASSGDVQVGGWNRNFATQQKPTRPLPERALPPDVLEELEAKHGMGGKYLKAIREYKGITLNDIAERTKVQTTYLRYLEEERFNDLPPAVYVEGFINQVARLLKLDVKHTVGGYMKHYHRIVSGGGQGPDVL